MSRRALALGSMVALALLAGCDDEELILNVENFDNLGPDFRYAAWVLDDDGDLDLAGTFDVTDGSTILFDEPDPEERLETEVDEDDAERFLITIERIDIFDLDPDLDGFAEDLRDELDDLDNFDEIGPVLVAGTFVNGIAQVRVGDDRAFGTNFSDVTGSYILVTPSTAAIDDHDQGIWWMTPEFDAPTLNLPALPDGWVYENWLVTDEVTGDVVSLGSYTDPSTADSDGPGPAAGPEPVPNFPGQDFIDPAMSVVGMRTFTTIELVDDFDADSPSGLVILEDGEITDVGRATLQTMANTADAELPRATVRYEDIND